jgi:hypothetical protein
MTAPAKVRLSPAQVRVMRRCESLNGTYLAIDGRDKAIWKRLAAAGHATRANDEREVWPRYTLTNAGRAALADLETNP